MLMLAAQKLGNTRTGPSWRKRSAFGPALLPASNYCLSYVTPQVNSELELRAQDEGPTTTTTISMSLLAFGLNGARTKYGTLGLLSARRFASTNSAKVFGLKDPSLVRFQGLINGKWVDANDGGLISVNSEPRPELSHTHLTPMNYRPGYRGNSWHRTRHGT
jgi:hypothetical protein